MEDLRAKTQSKVMDLLAAGLYTKSELARALNVERQTIYNRLRDVSWKGREINIILNEL